MHLESRGQVKLQVVLALASLGVRPPLMYQCAFLSGNGRHFTTQRVPAYLLPTME